jgi:hypothetical protein
VVVLWLGLLSLSSVSKQYVVVLWLGLLLLSSVIKHNMWSYHDWVYCCWPHIVYWRTTTTINPVIIPPHIVFTDGRQQRQPNLNMTTYCVYWRTKTTINPIIIRPHIVYTDTQNVVILRLGCRCCRPSVNTICGRIMIGFIVVFRQ